MDKIYLYITNVNTLKNEQLYSIAYSKLSPERKEKVDKLKLPKDKFLSVGAEILLQYGLNKFGVSPQNIKYKYGENGKPYLYFPDKEIFFNIAHSKEFAICGFSNQEIGCDIEKITDININIAKRFFTKSEYELISMQSTKQAQNDMFYRIWTLKESYIKMLGLGMKLSLNQFQIDFKNNIPTVQNNTNKNYIFKEIDTVKNYKCAVCSHCNNIEKIEIDISKILNNK